MGIWAEGTVPDSALGREDAGDASAPAEVNFPKNLIWGKLEAPVWSLLSSSPSVFPPGIPGKPRSRSGCRREQLPPPAPGTNAQVLSIPVALLMEKWLYPGFLGEMDFPKKSCPYSAPSQLLGGRHRVAFSRTRLFFALQTSTPTVPMELR